MSKILGEVQNIPDQQLQGSLEFAGKGLQHALQDVRQPAQKCIVELYKWLGDEVRQHFDGLRPAQVE